MMNIRNINDGKTAYSGDFQTMADCIEQALNDGINLSCADLRGAMLAHANLDGGNFSGALFDGADLTGANLSECTFKDTSFRGVDFNAAALCESRLSGCDFTDASFGRTLLDGASLVDCRFNCPSALGLPFSDARHLGSNLFGIHAFSSAPVVVSGLPKRIVFLDDVVLIGLEAYDRLDFPNPFEGLFQSLTGPEKPVSSLA